MRSLQIIIFHCGAFMNSAHIFLTSCFEFLFAVSENYIVLRIVLIHAKKNFSHLSIGSSNRSFSFLTTIFRVVFLIHYILLTSIVFTCKRIPSYVSSYIHCSEHLLGHISNNRTLIRCSGCFFLLFVPYELIMVKIF